MAATVDGAAGTRATTSTSFSRTTEPVDYGVFRGSDDQPTSLPPPPFHTGAVAAVVMIELSPAATRPSLEQPPLPSTLHLAAPLELAAAHLRTTGVVANAMLVIETFSLVTVARKPLEPVAKMLLCSSSDPPAASSSRVKGAGVWCAVKVRDELNLCGCFVKVFKMRVMIEGMCVWS